MRFIQEQPVARDKLVLDKKKGYLVAERLIQCSQTSNNKYV